MRPMRPFRCALVIAGVLATGSAPSAQGTALPSELAFLTKSCQPYNVTYEPWASVQTPPGNYGANGVGKVVGGKHWDMPLIVPGAKTSDAVWTVMKQAFLANDWTVLREWTAGGRVLWMHYQKNGVEAWATLNDPSAAERSHIEVIEAAPPPFTLTLTPPAAVPEDVDADSGDFPYLAPVQGSSLHKSQRDSTPFSVTMKGAAQAEIVAPGSIIKSYAAPKGFANSFFTAVYEKALTTAGWTIVNEFSGADALIAAHYARNGRNLWAVLHKSGDSYDLTVGDAGDATKGLGAELATNCHVAVYGIFFDFDKSTLQPASDPVLQQILSLLTKDPSLALEVQGHTDNVGDDAYNQRLSEARAKSVVAWLSQKGVAPGRLTANGYGKNKPVADNATDQGRAKNRRVEIANPRCTAK